jgi:hypothetical protein
MTQSPDTPPPAASEAAGPPRTSGFAIAAAVILGLTALVSPIVMLFSWRSPCFLLGLLALWLLCIGMAAAALVQCYRHPKALKGRWLAWSVIILALALYNPWTHRSVAAEMAEWVMDLWSTHQ